MSLMRDWGTGWLPGVLPTSMTRTEAGSRSTTARGASRSTTTTSAEASSSRPRAAQVQRSRDERPLDPVADGHGQAGVAGGIRGDGDPAVGGDDVGAGGD